MKTNLVLAGFVALSFSAQAQWSTGCPVTTSCDADLSTTSVNGGLTITQNAPSSSNPGSAVVRLKNNTTYGRDYVIGSTGIGNGQGSGKFSIYDYTEALKGGVGDRFIIDTLGDVGIGTPSPSSRLHAVRSYNNVQSINVPRSAGLFETTTNVWGTYIGSKGTATQTNPSTNLSLCYGLVGEASSGAGSWNRNHGVLGTASGGGVNTGGHFEANGGTGTLNFGVYAIANNGSGAWNDWAGYFEGKIQVTGDCYNNLTQIWSDRRFKKNIQPLENVIEKISKLGGYTYGYKSDEFKERRFDDKSHIGLIAQEIKEVFPELIREDDKGFLSVNYDGMIPVLLEAIKEQNKAVVSQQKQIAELQTRLEASENKTGNATGINQLNSSADGFGLEQNIPNPFSHETEIKYTLPKQIKNASLNVYDLSGKQLTSFPLDINAKSITITSDKLAAGIYIYSVIADGRIMDSKRMVVADKQ